MEYDPLLDLEHISSIMERDEILSQFVPNDGDDHPEGGEYGKNRI